MDFLSAVEETNLDCNETGQDLCNNKLFDVKNIL